MSYTSEKKTLKDIYQTVNEQLKCIWCIIINFTNCKSKLPIKQTQYQNSEKTGSTVKHW